MAISEGDRVKRAWERGEAEGVAQAVHETRMEREIKGAAVARAGSSDAPALEIEQDDGERVLNLATEVDPA